MVKQYIYMDRQVTLISKEPLVTLIGIDTNYNTHKYIARWKDIVGNQ